MVQVRQSVPHVERAVLCRRHAVTSYARSSFALSDEVRRGDEAEAEAEYPKVGEPHEAARLRVVDPGTARACAPPV